MVRLTPKTSASSFSPRRSPGRSLRSTMERMTRSAIKAGPVAGASCGSDMAASSGRGRNAARAQRGHHPVHAAADQHAEEPAVGAPPDRQQAGEVGQDGRSEEHTSELQSQSNLVCRLLLEKKKKHTRTCTRGAAQLS